MPGPPFDEDLVAGGNVDDVDRQIGKLGRGNVAARLSPPDLDQHQIKSPGNFHRISAIAARLAEEASSRIAVCGQPRRSRRRRCRSEFERAGAHQIFGVPFGVDVVGDGRDLVALAHPLAQRVHQRRLARSDRAANADAQQAMLRCSHSELQAHSPATNSSDLPACACSRRVVANRSLTSAGNAISLANSGRCSSLVNHAETRGCSRANG